MGDENKTENLQVRCTPELIRQLDELRRAEPDIPGRAEMARRCIERAIAEAATKVSRPRGTQPKRGK